MSEMESWNIGVLGFERIIPSFHPSTIPIFSTLDEAIERNEAYESFSAAC